MTWSRLQKSKLGPSLNNGHFYLEVILKKVGGLTNLSLYRIIVAIGSVAIEFNWIQAFEVKAHLSSCWPTAFNEQTASKRGREFSVLFCPESVFRWPISRWRRNNSKVNVASLKAKTSPVSWLLLLASLPRQANSA